jgi:hypothetical protein
MCRDLTSSIYKGMDWEHEIIAVRNQKLGDTILLWDGEILVGVAVCHCGPGTEAGGDTCYVKLGLVRSGSNADSFFDMLLDAVEELAISRGLATVVAGINTGCQNACRRMISRGYRSEFQGVMMLNPSEPAFDTPDRYVICDLR